LGVPRAYCRGTPEAPPKMAARLAFTPVSEQQAVLIETWAASTGRSVSALCASLLDEAVTAALDKMHIPGSVVAVVDELFAGDFEHAKLTAELTVLKTRKGFLSDEARINILKQEIQEIKIAKKAGSQKG